MEKEAEKPNSCSPDTVLEDFLRRTDSDSDSSKPSTSEPEHQILPKRASLLSDFLPLLSRFKSKRHLAPALNPVNAFKLSKKFSSSMREKSISSTSNSLKDANMNYFRPQWSNFSYQDLQAATSNFFQGYLIGKGGYAEVYRGRLRGGQLVAIKRLTRVPLEERTGDFLSELGIMAHVNHPNTAKLIGYGVECGLYLVLEFSPIGSLASLLHSCREKVGWDVRYKIALGTAKGLLYLHEGCQRRIIHRDIKAGNILLTEDFEPQICDFGLAKWLPDRWTHLTVSKCEGTFGYLAPEFLMHGIVDEKTDVFAFGVLLLELITGRRALDYSQLSLVMWAKPMLKKNKIGELIDPSLGEEEYDSTRMNLMVLTASLCVQQSPAKRPRMSQALLLLRGSCGSVEVMRKSKRLSTWKKYYRDLFGAEKYNRGGGLRALDLRTQMALET